MFKGRIELTGVEGVTELQHPSSKVQKLVILEERLVTIMEGFEENEDQTEDEPETDPELEHRSRSYKHRNKNTSVEDSKERETTKEQGERKWRKSNWSGSAGWETINDPTGKLNGRALIATAGITATNEDYLMQVVGTISWHDVQL